MNILKNWKNEKIIFILIIILIADQFTKIIVSSCLQGFPINIIDDFFYIDFVKNSGAAFSIFQDWTFLLIILTVVILVLLIYALSQLKNINRVQIYAYGLVLGGTIGNFIDRLLYGYVLDFFSFKFGNFYFPVFNIADCALVIGVILYIVDVIVRDKHEKNSSSRWKYSYW